MLGCHLLVREKRYLGRCRSQGLFPIVSFNSDILGLELSSGPDFNRSEVSVIVPSSLFGKNATTISTNSGRPFLFVNLLFYKVNKLNSVSECVRIGHVHNTSELTIMAMLLCRGVYEARFVFAISILRCILPSSSSPSDPSSILLPMLAVLSPPQNTILFPLILLMEKLLNRLCLDAKLDQPSTFNQYLISAAVLYFAQGNSNSLASVDLAAGYTGMTSYRPFLIGFLIALNTYGGYLLLILLFLRRQQQRWTWSSSSLETVSVFLLTERSLEVFFFMVIVTAMRYHLFVWTVFSPKLLYELAFSVFIAAVMTVIVALNDTN